MPPLRCLSLLLLAVVLGAGLAGCAPAAVIEATIPPDVVDLAGLRATQILQQAEATAIVRRAEATAQALLAAAGGGSPTPPPATPVPPTAAAATATPGGTPQAATSPSATPQASATPVVQLLKVGFGAQGNFIHVEFIAAPRVAGTWVQGNVYVIDEGSGTTYKEIPVMPVIGPLLAKPKSYGAIGYVMLVNNPPIPLDALVTVVLGEYRFEHVPLTIK